MFARISSIHLLVVALVACPPSPPAPPPAVASALPEPAANEPAGATSSKPPAPEPPVPPPPLPLVALACPEPQGLRRLNGPPPDDDPSFRVELRKDNLTEHAAEDGPPRVTDGARSYTLEGDYGNTLVARDGGREIWRVAGFPIAGGLFTLSLTPDGRFVTREYSREGEVVLFDARTGARYAVVGRDVVFDPEGRFGLDPPHENVYDRFDRAQIHKLELTPGQPRVRSIVSLPIDLRKKVEEDEWYFGVAVCATGAFYAVSHPGQELGIYRSQGDVLVARLNRPPLGKPAFSRSGRYLTLDGGERLDIAGERISRVVTYELTPGAPAGQ